MVVFDFYFFFVRPLSPEFCYRPGLSSLAEDGAGGSGSVSSSALGSSTNTGGGGAPNRPLPPTPDDDDSHGAHGDRTLVMKRVCFYIYLCSFYNIHLNIIPT